VHHPLFALVYSAFSPRLEAHGVRDHRLDLVKGLEGRVLEVGSGAGGNLEHYPGSVDHVIAVEPERSLLHRATSARRAVPVEFARARAERLPFVDGAFDSVLFSLVLCSVLDPDAALAEAMRVLRPGGELRFYEHVRAAESRRARRQDRVDPIWRRVAGGCRCNRDTVSSIAGAGFAITSMRRFDFPDSAVWLPVAPHVLGVAIRPS